MMLVFLAPLMLLVVALIKIEGKGPLLFAQRRIGEGGRPILVYKFRTFRVQGGEIRLSWVGRLIRRYSLDELPSLFNVFRGDLGLFGHAPGTEPEDAAEIRKPGLVPPEAIGVHGPQTIREYAKAIIATVKEALFPRR
jgi:lipopolysaccharide/colanic/teichoic acid biosynthesis glycosyltransferase